MPNIAPRINIIIVAAGTGSRFGGKVPKQFCLMAGRPLLMHTIDAMRRALPGAKITVVLASSMMVYWKELCRRYSFQSPDVTPGGASRWESVRNAVMLDSPYGENEIILVHDGARPLVDKRMVEMLVDSARLVGAVIPVVAVTNSLRHLDGKGLSHAIDRSEYVAVQTPQAFDAGLLCQAYGQPFSPSFTDDASVVEALGHNITLVEGSTDNIKITNPGDIETAELLMRRQFNP
ncbi:MAG: 2-C-methyl-D-erythritol 4-phosphate cytidylyltransferase [Muribaculaceae bacterium]|nr:2-C-methyl-D-erythritol 4-phosphate cytidylyltransferase [Bacteroidales bacterium]